MWAGITRTLRLCALDDRVRAEITRTLISVRNMLDDAHSVKVLEGLWQNTVIGLNHYLGIYTFCMPHNIIP